MTQKKQRLKANKNLFNVFLFCFLFVLTDSLVIYPSETQDIFHVVEVEKSDILFVAVEHFLFLKNENKIE